MRADTAGDSTEAAEEEVGSRGVHARQRDDLGLGYAANGVSRPWWTRPRCK